MNLEIKKHEGRWLVNNQPVNNLSPGEKRVLDELISGAKLESLNIKEESNKFPDWAQILNEK